MSQNSHTPLQQHPFNKTALPPQEKQTMVLKIASATYGDEASGKTVDVTAKLNAAIQAPKEVSVC